MKTLLISVMTVSLSAGVIHLLAPEGKLRKPISFVIALIICATLLAPLSALLGREIDWSLSLPEISVSEKAEANQILIALTAETICRDLEKDIAARYGLKQPHLTLTLDSSNPEAVLMVSGTLTGEGEGDMAATYLTDLLRCPISWEPLKREETQDGLS